MAAEPITKRIKFIKWLNAIELIAKLCLYITIFCSIIFLFFLFFEINLDFPGIILFLIGPPGVVISISVLIIASIIEFILAAQNARL
ncbi:hypothetical protein MsAg5_07380 [Methanosarcinaceae archaeon Ag5]|uniref:Uncharacterized protein n=1 Tax=Methanolapillus africanus TaxID=3028297 RepID=A0AAE4SF15_9EURY|nr:hypothetical protein [Methanosarcinaceae archaeon Ag5]